MLNLKITDSTFHNVPEFLFENFSRITSRGVIFNENNEVIMLHMKSNGFHKLIGGGKENNETPQETFYREAVEETGYEIEIIKELGFIEEHKKETSFCQLSHCFLAKTVSIQNSLNLTQSELALGVELKSFKMEDAIKLMNDSFENCKEHKMKFMIFRDLQILKYANNL